MRSVLTLSHGECSVLEQENVRVDLPATPGSDIAGEASGLGDGLEPDAPDVAGKGGFHPGAMFHDH